VRAGGREVFVGLAGKGIIYATARRRCHPEAIPFMNFNDPLRYSGIDGLEVETERRFSLSKFILFLAVLFDVWMARLLL